MNDFQQMKALLLQMEYKEVPEGKMGHHELGCRKEFYVGAAGLYGTRTKGFEYQYTIGLGAGTGYGGFCCEFFFDDQGKAIIHGCWE